MSNTQNQIGYDGPQHIDGVATPPGMGQDISKAMPPQDVMDAAMLLTEACSAWSPAPPPKFDINALPAELPAHNQSYLMHRDLCSLATDPVGFNDKLDDVFGTGMLAAVVLVAVAWLLGTMVSKAFRFVFKRRAASAEVLKGRLMVEAAKAKLDAKGNRPAAGAAE